MRIISLGWGVQSWGLAAMVALGKLPPVDAAVHADTTHERRETYEFAAQWTPWLEERGVRVVTVKGWDRYMLPYDAMPTPVSNPQIVIPVHQMYPDGPGGMIRRQCTGHWKIRPVRRWIQENRNGATAQQWIGITLDEWTRAKDSDVKYIENRFPLLDLDWRRGDVMRWLQNNGLPIPVKSSCTFCPYHDLATWREIKLSGNGDWQKAVDVDRAIRDKRPGYKCYLHAQRIPLDEVDVRNEQDHGQLELWDVEECTGNCFP